MRWKTVRTYGKILATPLIQSHNTKSHMLVTKLHNGTFKTKAGLGGLVEVALFWNSHCATYLPPCMHDFVPCDWIVQRAYSIYRKNVVKGKYLVFT